jgi:hypothetical protein
MSAYKENGVSAVTTQGRSDERLGPAVGLPRGRQGPAVRTATGGPRGDRVGGARVEFTNRKEPKGTKRNAKEPKGTFTTGFNPGARRG